MSTICTARQGTNADLFPSILAIYVPEGSTVADVTWGKGVFWQKVDLTKYTLLKSDLAHDGIDARKLPYADVSLDAVILDPPYIYNPGNSLKKSIDECYNNNTTTPFKTQKDVIRFYQEAAQEALRVLKKGGVLILKCKDTIESGKQVWTHVELMQLDGYLTEDLFVLVQNTTPVRQPAWGKQKHAPKNH